MSRIAVSVSKDTANLAFFGVQDLARSRRRLASGMGERHLSASLSATI